MMNIMNPPADWSTLKKLIWLRGTPTTGGEELTVSGTPPLSLPNSLGKPLKAWNVSLSPYQDLHGYANPWPAGGGVNKVDNDNLLVGYISNDNGGFNPTGGSRATDFIPVTAGESYRIVTEQTSGMWGAWYDESKVFISGITNYLSVPVITAPTNAKYVRLTVSYSQSNPHPEYFALNYPSTVTTWSPYSNICPILGTDKVTVWTDSKYGGLVEWNQLVENGNFADGTSSWHKNSSSNWSVSEGILTQELATGVTTNRIYHSVSVATHKYLISAQLWADSVTSAKMALGGTNTSSSMPTVNINSTRTRYDIIYDADGTEQNLLIGCRENLAESSNFYVSNVQCFDLTQMFGAGNEPESVEAFRALFPLDYYAYDTGTQKTVDQVNGSSYQPTVITIPTLSANQWDEEWELGTINNSTGQNSDSTTEIRCKNYIPVQPDTNYCFVINSTTNGIRYYWYDSNKDFISSSATPNSSTSTVVLSPENAYFLKIRPTNNYGATYLHNIAINLPSSVTTYNPYNNTVYTGTVGSDGGESRDAIIDMGDLSYSLSTGGGSYNSFVTNGVAIKAPSSGADIINAICTGLKSLSYNASWTPNSIAPHTSTSNLMRVILPTTVTTAQECKEYVSGMKLVYERETPTTFAVPSVTIPTPTGTATTWATAEDGIVDSMSVTYIGKASS